MDDDRLKRHDLTDTEWARLVPLLPPHPRQGHRWNDHRTVINGVSSGPGLGARGGTRRARTGTGRRGLTAPPAGRGWAVGQRTAGRRARCALADGEYGPPT